MLLTYSVTGLRKSILVHNETENIKILVVDDDRHIRTILDRYLQLEGYEVIVAESGKAMRAILNHQKPDLAILDLGLPDTTGFELAEELRNNDANIGIIMLTGSGEKLDKIVSLETGADDYVEKPFDERELLARIRSVLRRRRSGETQNATPTLLGIENLRLNLRTRSLHDEEGLVMPLTHREFQLLSLLAANANSVLTRDQISESIASRDWLPTDRSIDVLVSKLRKKVETDPAFPSLIKTIRGSGYILTGRVQELSE